MPQANPLPQAATADHTALKTSLSSFHTTSQPEQTARCLPKYLLNWPRTSCWATRATSGKDLSAGVSMAHITRVCSLIWLDPRGGSNPSSQHKAYGPAKPQHPLAGSPKTALESTPSPASCRLSQYGLVQSIEPRMLGLPAYHKLCAGCHPGPVVSYFLW
jgi:hypothetical protein